MTGALAGWPALWNRSHLDLRSDEQLAQIMDRGGVAEWRELYRLAAADAAVRRRMLAVVHRVPLGFPAFWLAALAALGEHVDWGTSFPVEVGT